MKYWFVVLVPALISAAAAQEAAQPTPTATPATAAEEEKPEKEVQVIITPNRNPQSITESTSAVSVIPRQEIAAKKPLELSEVVRLAPSLSVGQNGTLGKSASIFIRGANSNHTLVLIDGVRSNSPADRRFDFGALQPENIERIEVLRGPQSALYGSDAIGGVINIITRRGEGPLRTGGSIEFGNQSTSRQIVSAQGQVGKGALSFSASRIKTNGFFANDDYKDVGASLRYDYGLTPTSNLTFTSRIDDGEVGTPGQQFGLYDPNARSFPRNIFGSVQWNNEARDGDEVRRRDRVSIGAYDRKLRFDDPINPGSAFPSFTNSNLKYKIYQLEAQSTLNRGAHAITIGGELRNEKSDVNSRSTFGNNLLNNSTNTQALWIQDEFRRGRFSFVPGLRLENNSQFGSDLNGRLAAGYDLNTLTRLKGSFGTGFSAPSFNDLYFPNYGNPNLKPEESRGFDIGIERQLRNNGRLEVMAFSNRITNLIAAVAIPQPAPNPPIYRAANIGRARTQGLEFAWRQPLSSGLTLNMNHAFLSTSNGTTALIRRPRFASNVDLYFQRNRISADLGVVAQGRYLDFAGAGTGYQPGFVRLDLTMGYDIRPGVQVFTRVQNLLDKKYAQAAGFPAPGLNFTVGIQTRAF
jgi:vitamin B12 transporter